MKINYVSAEFEFDVHGKTYFVKYENTKPPYLANVFHEGNYIMSYEVNTTANKSNAANILRQYLQQ